ncbi:MAG: hypothetical protein LBF68_05230 [Christensenellaceae bacterium]|jgi:hypothetical protein|nr:hypothetical protein [Christensenellaceae bacterium]
MATESNYYSNYFEIDESFSKVVASQSFKDNPEMWKSFHPHERFKEFLNKFIDMINGNDFRIWVVGAFGTGKSYAVLTLKKMLEVDSQELDEYFNKYNRLSNDLLSRFKAIRNNNDNICVSFFSGYNLTRNGEIDNLNNLITRMCLQISYDLEERGYQLSNESLIGSAVGWLRDKINANFFQGLIDNDRQNRLNKIKVNDLINRLETTNDTVALTELVENCNSLAKERELHIFKVDESNFEDWIKNIMIKNKIDKYLFIWDEFAEYLENCGGLSRFTTLFLENKIPNFYLMPVIPHINMLNDNKYNLDILKKHRDRIHEVEFNLSDDITYELIASALVVKPPKEVEWENVAQLINNNLNNIQNVMKEKLPLNSIELLKKIVPLHPYAAYVLKCLAEKIHSNQRSLFDFLKTNDPEIKGFKYFIDNTHYIETDKENIITVDFLWEFFEYTCYDDSGDEIHAILDYYNRINNSGNLTGDQFRVFKTILLLNAISKRFSDNNKLLLPNLENLEYAFMGSKLSMPTIKNICNRLVKDQIFHNINNLYSTMNEYSNNIDIQNIKKTKESTITTREIATDAGIKDLIKNNATSKPIIYHNDLRFIFILLTSENKDYEYKNVKNNISQGKYLNKIIVFLCVSRNSIEHGNLKTFIENNQEYKNSKNEDSSNFVFIDLFTQPLNDGIYNNYINYKAHFEYYDKRATDEKNKNNEDKETWKKKYLNEIKLWYKQIDRSPCLMYYKGFVEKINTIKTLVDKLININKTIYIYAPENWCDATDDLYKSDSIDNAIHFGSKHKKDYSQNYHKTVKDIDFAWNAKEYWNISPDVPLSKIKIFVDNKITNDIKDTGRSSLSELYNELINKPYGFTKTKLSSFLFGFLLKEYAVDNAYYYNDGKADYVLNPSSLVVLCANIIKQLDIKYYIKSKSIELINFAKITNYIFDIDESLCIEGQVANAILKKLPNFMFPLWVISYIDKDEVINELISLFFGVINPQNYNNKNEICNATEIYIKIGTIYKDNPTVVNKFKSLISAENCRLGMVKFLKNYKDGILPKLCNELAISEDTYLQNIKDRFNENNADSFMHNRDDQIKNVIDPIIDEYKVILISRKLFPNHRFTSIDNIKSDWLEFIKSEFKVPFELYLNNINLNEHRLFNQIKQLKDIDLKLNISDFYDAIEKGGKQLVEFRDTQFSIFSKVSEVAKLDDNFKLEIYKNEIGYDHFDDDLETYKTAIIDSIKKYNAKLKKSELSNIWFELTKTKSPSEWSNEKLTPILIMSPLNELDNVKFTFDIINKNDSSEDESQKALEYLNNMDWLVEIDSKELIESKFIDIIIGNYNDILNIDKVRELLINEIPSVYDWFPNNKTNELVTELASSSYIKNKDNIIKTKALRIINDMNLNDLKNYFMDLVNRNLSIGMELVKDKGNG